MDDRQASSTPTEEVRALLEAVRRTPVELVTATPGPLRRIAVSAGEATVEVDWAESPTAPTSPADDAAPPGTGADSSHFLRSPMVGTFYVAPEPGAQPFVAVDDVVEPGQTVGLIEAMKLMNPVEADRTGRIMEVIVSDHTSVEYDQPLMRLLPLSPNGWDPGPR